MENNNQNIGCKKCKQKGPGAFQIGSIILGFYVLFSSIYGTIEIGKSIISWVKLSFGI
jgi:hypothetical protein